MQRDARHEAIVQMLLDREVEDRDAREKRQLRYRQYLESGSGPESSASSPSSPLRRYKFRTKVPCRVTPDARALLDQLKKQFCGSTVTFLEVTSRQQAVMLTGGTGTKPKQIGWVEHCVQTDPKLCNVRNQGLAVETDGSTMLVLRFRYPPTAVRMSSRHNADDEAAWVDFTEIRPALDLRPSDEGSSPRLVWVTRPEVETIDALGSRDYEAFYVRFKLEVQAGIWNTLSGLLGSSPGSQWHRGSYYTVVWEPDATNGRICQRTVDDSGSAIDIGLDRIYDASAATDILLLYLGGDILADFADIYFTLQSLSPADAYLLKEEFFALIRRFWASTPSLTSRYGSELAAVERMSQRAVPTPAQALLLKEDWTNLRQSLFDRYGEGGRNAADLVGQDVDRPHNGPDAWPFATSPAGEVNVGLRLVYRQEWRHLPDERSDTTGNLNEVVDEAAKATVKAMKWPLEVEGSINTGVRGLAAKTDMGLEWECRESSRDTSTRLTDIMRRMAGKIRDETSVLTRPAEIQNVVLVAEKLPTPAEIDLSWVKRHDWILAKVLLDESFRDALDSISQEARSPDSSVSAADLNGARDETIEHVDTFSGTATVRADGIDMAGEWTRGYRDPAEEELERLQRDLELAAKRDRLYEHLRANILHYQRAIWQQEDPQQRSMRHRKSGKKVPLEWRFELESGGALTIDELSDQLTGTNVDGQFAAYSAGREADLDQVIDPAGPIGYYGNYAIYHMRPEFGSEDLFSMLHFFKSPYLRPNPETGEPEVVDPVQIQISEDPAVVIDVIRSAASAPEKPNRSHGGVDLREAPKGCQLILKSGRGIELLSANGHRDPNAEWAILRGGGERMPSLLAGARGGAARANDPEAERVIFARDGGLGLISVAGAGAAPAHERVIRARGDGERTPTLLAGTRVTRAHDPEAERVILAGGAGERMPNLLAGAGAARARDPAADRVIFARDDEGLRPSLVAG